MGATHVRVGSAIFGARGLSVYRSGWRGGLPGGLERTRRRAMPASSGCLRRSWSARRCGRAARAAAAACGASWRCAAPRAARRRRARSRARRRPRSPWWLMVERTPALDHRSRSCCDRASPAAERVLPPASLVGRSATGTSRKFMRVGSGTPAPKANTSRGAERRDEDEQAGAGVRHRRADQRLVAVVRQPHHEHRAALGDDGGVDLGRALRDEAEEHAVLAAFLGDARQRAPRRPEADLACRPARSGAPPRRRTAAARRRRSTGRSRTPCGDSTETTESTTSAGKPASCMMVIGLPLRRHPEQVAQNFRHGVAADSGVLEHEGVARVVAEGLDALRAACCRSCATSGSPACPCGRRSP